MSNPTENMEVDKGFGRRSGKEPERSNFSQTCSLLSQYLKRNGSFSELSVEVAKKLEAAKGKSEIGSSPVPTRELLPIIETSSGMDRRQNVDPPSPFRRPADLVPKFPDPVQEAIGKSDFGKPATKDPETAQLTLFYAGQVLVFNDFPAEKVKEVISVARKASSQIPSVSTNPSTGIDKVNSGKSVSFSPHVDSLPTISPTSEHVQVQPLPETNGSGLRIARRSSLHKFFEKRKDRAIAKAPYQVNNNNNAASSPKPAASNSRLDDMEEAQTSNNLELKL